MDWSKIISLPILDLVVKFYHEIDKTQHLNAMQIRILMNRNEHLIASLWFISNKIKDDIVPAGCCRP